MKNGSAVFNKQLLIICQVKHLKQHIINSQSVKQQVQQARKSKQLSLSGVSFTVGVITVAVGVIT